MGEKTNHYFSIKLLSKHSNRQPLRKHNNHAATATPGCLKIDLCIEETTLIDQSIDFTPKKKVAPMGRFLSNLL